MAKRRWWLLNPRVLLLLVLIFAAWLGWQVNTARRPQRAVAAIQEYGGFVHYEHELVRQPGGYLNPDTTLESLAPR